MICLIKCKNITEIIEKKIIKGEKKETRLKVSVS